MQKPADKPLEAALYARVSLEEQADNFSPDSQLRGMRQLAREKGYAVSPEFTFVDIGCLGGEMDRPQFVRMRQAIARGQVQVVLGYDLDRIVRGLALQLVFEEECARAGAILECCNMPADDSPEGIMLRHMRGVFAEYEKHKIRERTSRGRREKAQQGYVVGGRPPYGYRRLGRADGNRGELVEEPEQARIVRRIYSETEAGRTPLEIARGLNRDGVPCLRARQWTKSVIARILRSRTYIGEYFYNRRVGVEPAARRVAPKPGQSKKTSQRFRPESEWIPVACPALIERRQWDRVQAAIARSARLNVGGQEKQYPLRGLIQCGLCGRSCCVYPNHGRPRYRCSNIDRVSWKRLCPAPSAPVGEVEGGVWKALEDLAKDPDRLLAQAEAEHRRAAAAQAGAATARRRLQAQIDKAKRDELQGTNLLMDSDLADSHPLVREKLKALGMRRRALERELAALEPAPLPAFSREAFIRFSRDYLYGLYTASEERKRSILVRSVERILLVSRTELKITFRLAPGREEPGDGGSTQRFHRVDDETDVWRLTVTRSLERAA